MELDELKNRARGIKAPSFANEGFEKSASQLEGLVNRLKEQDAHERVYLRRMKIFFGIAAAVYAAIFTLTWIFPPDGPPGRSRTVLALTTLIFVTVVTASVVRARRIAATDYSSPVGAFLREAERRCAFVNWRAIGLFLPFFIIATLTAGLGWMNAFERYFPHLGESTGLVAFSILWACNCLIAAAAGTIWWKKKRKPLFDEIKRLRRELASEE